MGGAVGGAMGGAADCVDHALEECGGDDGSRGDMS